VTVRLVLASASAGRLAVLRAAGVEPEPVVSGVDESGVAGAPATVALELARRKARAVAALPLASGALVLGCDSLLALDGVARGKPADAADALDRWQSMRGRTGSLLTGHCLVDARTAGPPTEIAEVARTEVRFGEPSAVEIAAYIRSGEPLEVAGAFTLDGLGGWFVESVEGAPSNVVGLSLPVLRRLLAARGVSVADLWPAANDPTR
jgi:septum formation protein